MPPLAELFPLIEGNDFDLLVADIKKNGVREPIWLYDDKILDGRNRYRAAKAAKVVCPTRVYRGDDPLSFVISLNLKRRHLDESQRAMVAKKLANMPLGGAVYRSANLPTDGVSQSHAATLLFPSQRDELAVPPLRLDACLNLPCPRHRGGPFQR
jgi:hypothetical protein